jgi:ElaB/YqjD/DUF883 family membrane-anchored ribosome-binding protein
MGRFGTRARVTSSVRATGGSEGGFNMTGTAFAEGLGHVAAEIEHLKTAAEKGTETAIREARVSMRRARYAAEDARDEVVHQMKRHPLESAGVAFGAGLVTGLGLGMALFFRRGRRAKNKVEVT